MTTVDAVRTGFRIARRYARIGAIETIWRTAYAILVTLVTLIGFVFFARGVTLNNLEVHALRSKNPFFVSMTVQHLLGQYGNQIRDLTLFVVAFSLALWLLSASLFRAGIVGMLARVSPPRKPPIPSRIGINTSGRIR
jgi:hypothetical protein